MAKCNTWKKFVRKSGQKRRNKISSRELSNQADKFLTPLKLFQYNPLQKFFSPDLPQTANKNRDDRKGRRKIATFVTRVSYSPE